jgi:phosphoribosylamine--glycine ligase
MNVLVIGSGGREYALYWRLKKDGIANNVYVYPGNGGIREEDRIKGRLDDFNLIEEVIRQKRIELVVVGPEAPLVEGFVDRVSRLRVPIFGPHKNGAMLEGSKVYALEFAKKYGVNIPDFWVFDNKDDIYRFVKDKGYPAVLKADGLCAGKGVIIVNNEDELIKALDLYFVSRVFKDAANRVIVEDYIDGYELSVFVVPYDGGYFMFPLSQDHKRVYDGDKGPNTGGMGAYANIPVKDEVMSNIKKMIIEPTLEGIEREGLRYVGVIYFGIMVRGDEPYLLEYNVRFGDPEAQVILPLVDGNFTEFLYNVVRGEDIGDCVKVRDEYSIGVVLASEGYPGEYKKGFPIMVRGLKNHSLIFYAGVEYEDGKLLTNGGRVLTVVNMDKDFYKAKEKVYMDIEYIEFENKYYRKDIGYRMKYFLGGE